MKAYDLHLLQHIVYGDNAIDLLGITASELSARTALIVSDKGVAAAGHLDRACSSLQKASIETHLYDEVPENPTWNDVEKVVAFARSHSNPNLIIGLGGGSPMDCAKATNFILSDGEADFSPGMNGSSAPLIASIGIPTTAGTGSEAQSYAVIADSLTHEKRAYGVRNGRFDTVLLDPSLCASMPASLTANSGIDALSHVLESYVSTRKSEISQMLAREAWKKLFMGFERVLKSAEDLSARRGMLWGAHFAGAAIENSMLGAAHATANPITAHYEITHGSAVGLMLPHVIRMNGSVSENLYSELTQAVDMKVDRRPSLTLANWLEHIMRLAGLPPRLRDCGVGHEMLPSLAREASEQWTGRFNPRPVGKVEFLRLYKAAY